MKVLQVHCTYQLSGGEDTVVANEKSLLLANGLIVEELRFDNSGSALKKIIQAPFNIRSYIATRRKIREFQPDIVHLHNLHFAASPSVIFAIKRSGIPVVQTLHNYRLLCPSGILFFRGKLFLRSLRQRFPWTAVLAGVYHNSRLLTVWMALITKAHQSMGTWNMVDRYLLLTNHAKQIFLSSGMRFREGQLAVKPNFSHSAAATPATFAEHFVFVGRLSQEKGIEVLLDAFSSLPFKLKIAGDGPLRETVIAFTRKFSNIEYVGRLPKDLMGSFLSSARAMVFPSVWYEGMPMVIIEAFASGLPVIASRLGAMEEMIRAGYNGDHFTAGDREDLKRALIQCNNLSRLNRDAQRANARQTYLEHYTPEKNLDQLLGVYREAMHAGSPIFAA